MISLTFLEYELDEKTDKILSRLRWAVEEVESSWLDNMSWSTNPATHKDWIGEIDDRGLTFSLEEPGTFLKRKFNIVLKGNIESRASTTNVKVKLGLENFSFLWIFMIYLMAALMISDVFTGEEFDSYFSLSFFLIAYPLLGTFLINRRMKKAEKKLDKLFG